MSSRRHCKLQGHRVSRTRRQLRFLACNEVRVERPLRRHSAHVFLFSQLDHHRRDGQIRIGAHSERFMPLPLQLTCLRSTTSTPTWIPMRKISCVNGRLSARRCTACWPGEPVFVCAPMILADMHASIPLDSLAANGESMVRTSSHRARGRH